ncbi:hypothetical protein ABPG74_012440 [Tetrahymena malaccensis]
MRYYVITPILMSMGFFLLLNSLDKKKDAQSAIKLFSERQLERLQEGRQNSDLDQNYNKNRMLDNIIQENTYKDVFQGDWNQLPNFFNYFGGDHGIILLGLSYQPSSSQYDEIDFLLLDPQYDDEKKVYIKITKLNDYLTSATRQNQIKQKMQLFLFLIFINSWSFFNQSISVTTYNKNMKQSSPSVLVDFNMYIAPLNATQPLTESNSQFIISIISTPESSNQVGFSATLKVQDGDFTIPFLLYNLFISAFGLQQLYSVMALTNYIQLTNEIISTKMSMLTLGFITIYDSYVSLAHLYMALQYTNYFYYFILPTLIYFVMTTIVDMKLLILVWKNRCYVNFTTPSEIRKGFALFYAKFYISLIIFFTLTYFFYLYNEYLLFWPLFIVPQIVHNFMKGNTPLFSKNYMFGMIFSRAIIPFYFRACKYNIRNLAPSLYFSITYPLLFAFFILVLFLQYKIGPRFFVPRRFKGGYDYYKSYYSNEPVMDEDCPICMSKLKDDVDEEPADSSHDQYVSQLRGAGSSESEGSEANNAINHEKLVKKIKIIQTPCNHKYHISCFKSWINIKLECPSCRNPLKPLID